MSQVESSNPYQPPKSDPVAPSVAPDEPVLKSPWLRGWATIFSIVLLVLINFTRSFQPPDLEWDDSLKTAEIVTSIGAFVTYLLWIYHCAANVRVIDRRSPTSPGWAAGCHFIPFVNWVAPCLVLRDVARGTFKHRPQRGMDTIVILWWIALISRSILGRWADSVPIFLSWALASVVACLAIIYIIFRVCRGQAEFRWSDVPGADRPVMVPLGSLRAAIPGAPSDGHPLPPRQPLPPRRPSITMAEKDSPEGIPSPEIRVKPAPSTTSPGPPGSA